MILDLIEALIELLAELWLEASGFLFGVVVMVLLGLVVMYAQEFIANIQFSIEDYISKRRKRRNDKK